MRELQFELKELTRRHGEGSQWTQAGRHRTLQAIGRELQAEGFLLRHARNLKPRHVTALLDRWKKDGIAHATIRNRLGNLRWLAEKIGKPGLLPRSNESFGLEERTPFHPAFVLDVKPEIHDATARWRAANVGPVTTFAPGDHRISAGFNPLDFVPSEPVAAYQAIQRLVSLLMIPPARGTADFWEGRAAQMLGAALFDVALNNPFGRRDMTAVVDWFSSSIEELDESLARLETSSIRLLQRMGNQIRAMPAKQREGVFDNARRSIDVWGGPEVDDLVRHTTFDLRDLRRRNGTLYLCVTPEELVSYAGIIRCLFGMALFAIRDDREAWSMPPVTFFMDEFPQLGYLREVEQMLALGRQSGLRLWLFAQTIGQVQDIYRDADRLMEMMAVRCFMEPSGRMAQELSKELGTARDIWNADKERPLATPQELAGPDYADKVIVLEGGRQPARLQRVMAFEDPNLRDRLGPGR